MKYGIAAAAGGSPQVRPASCALPYCKWKAPLLASADVLSHFRAGTGRGRQSRGRDMPTAFTTAEGGFPLALAHLLWAPTAAVNFGGGLFLPELGLAGHGAPGSVPERDSAAPWLALHQRVKDTYLAYCYVESDPATDVPVVQGAQSRFLTKVPDEKCTSEV